jgi:hypothetical protein
MKLEKMAMSSRRRIRRMDSLKLVHIVCPDIENFFIVQTGILVF